MRQIRTHREETRMTAGVGMRIFPWGRKDGGPAMRPIPIRFRGKVVKVEYGYREETRTWYVADHNVDVGNLPAEADSPEELDAEVADLIDFLKAIDRDLEIERDLGGDR